jgi:hypothetical protein
MTTKAPYEPGGSLASYPSAPPGFKPVFTENVQRHGDRTDTSSTDFTTLLALWQFARTDGDLTPLGQTLGPELTQFEAANAAIGYGNLAPDGVTQIEAIAKRMYDRLPSLFNGASSTAAAGETAQRIEVVAASQERTVDSASAFVTGLEAADPGLTPVIGSTETNNNLLYFHKARPLWRRTSGHAPGEIMGVGGNGMGVGGVNVLSVVRVGTSCRHALRDYCWRRARSVGLDRVQGGNSGRRGVLERGR